MDYSESLMVGLKRASWLVAALAFVVSMIAQGDDDWDALVISVIVAAISFGLARLAIWVVDGFME